MRLIYESSFVVKRWFSRLLDPAGWFDQETASREANTGDAGFGFEADGTGQVVVSGRVPRRKYRPWRRPKQEQPFELPRVPVPVQAISGWGSFDGTSTVADGAARIAFSGRGGATSELGAEGHVVLSFVARGSSDLPVSQASADGDVLNEDEMLLLLDVA